MTANKEVKFFALIIPMKDTEMFFSHYPEHQNRINKAMADYAKFRINSGRKPYNNYLIVNQDEPYTEKVWQTILEGERTKLEPQKSELPSDAEELLPDVLKKLKEREKEIDESKVVSMEDMQKRLHI